MCRIFPDFVPQDGSKLVSAAVNGAAVFHETQTFSNKPVQVQKSDIMKVNVVVEGASIKKDARRQRIEIAADHIFQLMAKVLRPFSVGNSIFL